GSQTSLATDSLTSSATDSLTSSATDSLTSSATATDSLTSSATATNSLTSSATATDSLISLAADSLTSSATATDSLTSSATDSLISLAADSLTSSATGSQTSLATDSLTSSVTESLTSPATGSLTSSSLAADSLTSSSTGSLISSATDSVTFSVTHLLTPSATDAADSNNLASPDLIISFSGAKDSPSDSMILRTSAIMDGVTPASYSRSRSTDGLVSSQHSSTDIPHSVTITADSMLQRNTATMPVWRCELNCTSRSLGTANSPSALDTHEPSTSISLPTCPWGYFSPETMCIYEQPPQIKKLGKAGVKGFKMTFSAPPPRPPPVFTRVRSSPVPLQFVIDKEKFEYNLWMNTIIVFVTWTIVLICIIIIMFGD
ncbi:transmembrane protein, putative, partial [Bodo saltans]